MLHRNELLVGILFAFVCTALIFWNLISPGYILTLDTIFGPASASLGLNKFITEGSVFGLLVYGSSLLMPIWIFEKIFLSAIFFALFLVPYIALISTLSQHAKDDGSKDSNSNGKNEYFIKITSAVSGSILYLFNPFVYERIIAGHWHLLAGYALLPLVFYATLKSQSGYSFKHGVLFALLLCIISIFSLHVLVVAVIVSTIALLVSNDSWILLLKKAVTVVAVFLLLSSWYFPAVTTHANLFVQNQVLHENAFEITGDSAFSKFKNALLLKGFWLETSPWSKDFVMPQRDLPVSYTLGQILIGVCIVVGFVFLFRNRKNNKRLYQRFLRLYICVLVALFMYLILNPWIVSSQIELLRSFGVAFRDTAKLSVLLVFGYSLLYTLGTRTLLIRFKKYSYSVATLLVLLPVFYTPSLLFGISGGLKPVWYSSQWSEAVSLVRTPGCKVLSLPWYQYYSQSYLDYRLTANPVAHIVPCTTVVSTDSGVPGGKLNSQFRREVNIIDNHIKNPVNDQVFIDWLRAEGFTHVVYSMDVVGEDLLRYTFLTKLKPLNSYAEQIHESVLVFSL